MGPIYCRKSRFLLVSIHCESGDLLQEEKIVRAVRQWVESVVVDMNLCPFAKRELVQDRVRFAVAEVLSEEQLLSVLQAELELLGADPSIETTLLIHPDVLQDFYDYNQFLGDADRLLVQMQLDGIYQIASFHPDYQFGDTAPDDVENYTNRSPYPMLHLIREESLERAIASYPDVEQIPVRIGRAPFDSRLAVDIARLAARGAPRGGQLAIQDAVHPTEERIRAPILEPANLSEDVQVDVLQHVRGIGLGFQRRGHPRPGPCPQLPVVGGQQLGQCQLVPTAGRGDPRLGLTVLRHGTTLSPNAEVR